jgi:septum site-determining protein MinD
MVSKGEAMTVEDVEDILRIQLLGIVPEDEMIITTTNRGEPASMNEQSKAGQAYRNIARRLRGEEVPFMTFDEVGGIMGIFKKIFAAG